MLEICKDYIIDLLHDSYTYKLGHIPSALSVLPIVLKLKDNKIPLILGKSFGIQAWFLDKIVKNFFINHQEYKILTKEFFNGSLFNVKYCQQQLGLAAGFSIGYAIENNPCICLLSDGDVFLESTLSAIDLSFKLNLPINFIIDSNDCQLFNSRSVNNILKKYSSKKYTISEFMNSKLEIGPYVTIVKTIKGYGIKPLEKNPKEWHYRILSESEYNLFKDYLNETVS